MQINPHYNPIVEHFATRPVVTLATGATCAFTGDERSMREHLVTAEAARHLRHIGHTVVQFFINDNLDPLNFRQLRVAVNKDPELIDQFKDWCGKPIAYLPDPWGCCESYAAHFEEQVLNRLHYVGCYPTPIRVSKLYERGLYDDSIRIALEQAPRIRAFLAEKFPDYIPEKLFWPICPSCGYIDSTKVEGVAGEDVTISCTRCQNTRLQPLSHLAGKLNWKLDCAARWKLFNIDCEAFSQPYLEPHVGSFHIAQALSREFFDGHTVFPLNYGLVKMENKLGGKLLDSLTPVLLRKIFVEQPITDINLTRDFLVTAASRHEVQPGLTYLDFIKQILPIWLLTPHALTWHQREMVKHGISFGKEFLQLEGHLHLPAREQIEDEDIEVLYDLGRLLSRSIALRQSGNWTPADAPLGDSDTAQELQKQLQEVIKDIGPNKKAVLLRLRAIAGQEHGLPIAKLLLLLPLDYLNLLEYLIELFIKGSTPAPSDQELSAVGS